MIEVITTRGDKTNIWLTQEQLVTIRQAIYAAECDALVRGSQVNYMIYDDLYEEIKMAMIESWPEDDWN